jgi:hypothetical protein
MVYFYIFNLIMCPYEMVSFERKKKNVPMLGKLKLLLYAFIIQITDLRIRNVIFFYWFSFPHDVAMAESNLIIRIMNLKENNFELSDSFFLPRLNILEYSNIKYFIYLLKCLKII